MISALIVALIIAGCWLEVNLIAKSKYDRTREMISAGYLVVPMDQQTTTFLADVLRNWKREMDSTNGPDMDLIKLAGTTPTVRHLIEVWNFQMPPYKWDSPTKNRQLTALALMKTAAMPASVDKQWHLSSDGHLAVLHCRTNTVFVYRDEPSGLRVTLYARK
jgi:hypothetical protein